MNAQDEMQLLLRDIQTQIQVKGQAKVQADEPERMHRRLYKAIKRRGKAYLKDRKITNTD